VPRAAAARDQLDEGADDAGGVEEGEEGGRVRARPLAEGEKGASGGHSLTRPPSVELRKGGGAPSPPG
jgi:hypothetical protein